MENEKQINFKADNEIIKPPRVEIVESDAEEKIVSSDETKMVNQEEPDEDEISNSSSNLSVKDFFQTEKHVGFNVNTDEDPNSNCRLRRHDTPHYLKSARINNSKTQILGQNEMKDILNRYTPSAKTPPRSLDSNEKDSLRNDEIKKNLMLSLKIQRNSEKTLGISIVTGSNPNNDNGEDEDDDSAGVFVTKLLPGGLASNSGLCVGDQILNVIFNRIFFEKKLFHFFQIFKKIRLTALI